MKESLRCFLNATNKNMKKCYPETDSIFVLWEIASICVNCLQRRNGREAMCYDERSRPLNINKLLPKIFENVLKLF